MCIHSISKKERAKELVKENQGIFKCPVCSESMFINEHGSLTCISNHNFDLAKKGYLNLLASSNIPVYSKELFKARHEVCMAGLYDSFLEELTKKIRAYRNSASIGKLTVLDAGCGEGSHLSVLFQKIESNLKDTLIGVDISKDSINMAASYTEPIIWCVADLAKLPFQKSSFDIVLNILSPANYREFTRILNQEGIIIKAVPGASYLRELREIIYHDEKASAYSNEQVIEHFKENLELVDIQNIKYQFPVNPELWRHLLQMTPLTWGVSTDKLNSVLEKNISEITVDLAILTGAKRVE